MDQRSIRVFVSSTFRDMQAEREELIKRVFPQIRRMCEQRGVAWSEVDLRWGVTDEQKAEGAVLPICLAEIDRSWPYFLGLLGQRYGWVPTRSRPHSVSSCRGCRPCRAPRSPSSRCCTACSTTLTRAATPSSTRATPPGWTPGRWKSS